MDALDTVTYSVYYGSRSSTRRYEWENDVVYGLKNSPYKMVAITLHATNLVISCSSHLPLPCPSTPSQIRRPTVSWLANAQAGQAR